MSTAAYATFHEPTIVVRRMLEAEWNSTNVGGTFDHTKRISTGWWDDDNPYPQITVTPESGDRTYTGMDPGGSGPTSRPTLDMHVDIWAPNDFDLLGLHPKTFRWHLFLEVDRIVWDHAEGRSYTDSDGNTTELNRIEPVTDRPFVDPEDRDVTIYRWRYTIRVWTHQDRR